jgi:hypothetical protein
VTPVPNQSPRVLTACDGPRSRHPTTILPELPADGGGCCRSRRLGVTSRTGVEAAAVLAGGGKAALAEET